MKITRLFLLFAIAFGAFAIAPEASAQIGDALDTNSVLADPVESSGVPDQLNSILRWVFLLMRFLAVIVVGWGLYQMHEGQWSKGLWACAGAIGLFMSPAIVDLAKRIGEGGL